MYDVEPNYAGIVFRCFPYNDDSKQYEIHANVDSSNSAKARFNMSQTNKVTIMRKKVLYIIQIMIDTNFTAYFDTTVTFGSSLDANKNPYRYFTGRLTDVVIMARRY